MSEKTALSDSYNGELCSLIGYYENQKLIILGSFCVAVILKLYNEFQYFQYSVHILARKQNCPTIEVTRQLYYKFFTDKMQDSELTYSFVDSS